MALYTEQELIDFESKVADIFNSGKIKAPVHLHNGNEKLLIDVFDNIVGKEDWVMSTWRSHYHCLLHGVPQDELLDSIKAGRSITLAFPKYRILTSAIVGGILPIALGTALSIKRNGGGNKVIVFVGDMTAETGAYHECKKYAYNHGLPLVFVIEDNGLSVCTNTASSWGEALLEQPYPYVCGLEIKHVYKSKYPHAGAGKRIQF